MYCSPCKILSLFETLYDVLAGKTRVKTLRFEIYAMREQKRLMWSLVNQRECFPLLVLHFLQGNLRAFREINLSKFSNGVQGKFCQFLNSVHLQLLTAKYANLYFLHFTT